MLLNWRKKNKWLSKIIVDFTKQYSWYHYSTRIITNLIVQSDSATQKHNIRHKNHWNTWRGRAEDGWSDSRERKWCLANNVTFTFGYMLATIESRGKQRLLSCRLLAVVKIKALCQTPPTWRHNAISWWRYIKFKTLQVSAIFDAKR